MRSVTPLPRKVAHEIGEPAYALLIRTLEHNGGRRMNMALDRIAGTRGRAVSQFETAEVARLCKTDLTALAHATPDVGSKVATVMGQKLSAEQVSIGTRRWCPLCLAERPYHRVWWDIVPVTSCPAHGIELAASCGCKGRKLRWRHDRTQSCARGHRLAHVACVDAGPDARAFDGFVVARLLGDAEEGHRRFEDVPLGEFLTVCERLGMASLDEDAGIHKARKAHGTGRMHAEGFRILQGLPTTLDLVLERLHAGAGTRPGREGLAKSYGKFHQFVRELPEHSVGVALRRTLYEHANRHFAFRVRGRSRADLCADPGITLTAAADAVGMPLRRFRDLLDEFGIPYRAPEYGRSVGYRTEMTLHDFDALRPRLEGYLTLSRAAGELGLAGRDVVDLAEAGMLDLISSGQGEAGWLFPADAATKLLASLAGKAIRLGRADRGFRPLPRAAKACGTSVAETVALVLAGGIAARTGGGRCRGIPSYRVNPRALGEHLGPSGGEGRTTGMAGRELGINRATLGVVLAAGLLTTRSSGGTIRVPDTEIERFRTTWATMPELRRAMGTNAFQPVVSVLAAAGIQPAAAGSRLTDRIYPREAAMRACVDAADRPVPTPERGANRNSVARDLHMSATMLRQLVEAGLITMQEGCSFGSIAAPEVARFKKTYVTTPELKEAFGIRWSKTIVGLLRQAGVRPVCSPPAFHFSLFLRGEAEDALRTENRTSSVVPPPQVDEEPKLGVPDVAAQLNTSPNMVNQMLQAGILMPVRSIRRGQRTSVTVAEVERFRRAYVFANELGLLAGRDQRHGTGPTVTRKLLRNGIRPVCSTPEFSSYLFDRSEALALMARLEAA